MSAPNPRHANVTYLVTRRTSQRLMRLLPRGKALKQLIRYAIFNAASVHSVEIHAFCVLSTHIHLVCTDTLGNIPDFMHDALQLISRAANHLHGVKGELWDGRSPNYVALPAEGSAAEQTTYEKLVYTIVNPVEAILVKSCQQWPGVITTPGRTVRSGRAIRPKTAFFRRSKLPTSVDFKLTIPPALAHLRPEAFRQELGRRVAEAEARIVADARKAGKRFLGVRNLLRLDRFSAPGKNRERLGDRVPTIADRDPERRRARIRALQDFRRAYAKARDEWIRGLGEVLFPAGTFKLRGYPGVKVGQPGGT